MSEVKDYQKVRVPYVEDKREVEYSLDGGNTWQIYTGVDMNKTFTQRLEYYRKLMAGEIIEESQK